MMKKLLPIGIVLVTGLLVLTSCAKAPPPPILPTPVPAPYPAPGIKIPPPSPGEPTPTPAPRPVPTPMPAPMPPGTTEVGQTWATERMIVRTANMSLVVNEVPVTLDQIANLAEDSGGYVVSSRRWKEGERLVGTIVIRVPAEHFEATMRGLRGMAVDVTSETTSSKDVTEEYVDLGAKLQNLQAAEQQLLRIMEKAEKVEDILNVQRELSRTRGEIEQTKGRLQYLERTSATSLIEVRLEQAKLEAKFTADRVVVKVEEGVRFAPQIAGGFAPHSYEWDFGDKNTSTGVVPTHEYKSSGSYTVTLKVTDDRRNTDIETRKDYITVLPGWRAGSVAGGAWKGLVTFGQVLADIFIWIGIFSPVWVVIGGLIYWRRHRKKKASA